MLLANFPPSLHLSRHFHDRPTLAIVLHGHFRKHLVRGIQDCRPGTVLAEPAGEQHSNWFGPLGARVLLLQPDPHAASPQWEAVFGEPRAFLDGAIAELARRATQELIAPDELSMVAMEALGVELLVAAHRRRTRVPTGPPPAWLSRLEERLRAEFRQPLRMTSVTSDAGHHPVHVARVFRAHHGTTIAGYVRQLRIAWAQEQLRNPETLAAEVALDAGFSDQSHFSRAFRRVVGLSPRQWRRHVLARS